MYFTGKFKISQTVDPGLHYERSRHSQSFNEHNNQQQLPEGQFPFQDNTGSPQNFGDYAEENIPFVDEESIKKCSPREEMMYYQDVPNYDEERRFGNEERIKKCPREKIYYQDVSGYNEERAFDEDERMKKCSPHVKMPYYQDASNYNDERQETTRSFGGEDIKKCYPHEETEYYEQEEQPNYGYPTFSAVSKIKYPPKAVRGPEHPHIYYDVSDDERDEIYALDYYTNPEFSPNNGKSQNKTIDYTTHPFRNVPQQYNRR